MQLGTVTNIKTMGDNSKQMHIKLDNGKTEMFFSTLPGFNKSLKVGDKCKVYFKQTISVGIISYRATKIKA